MTKPTETYLPTGIWSAIHGGQFATYLHTPDSTFDETIRKIRGHGPLLLGFCGRWMGAAFWGLCYHNSALCTFIQEWWDGSWNQLSISSTHQTKNGNLNIIRKTCLKKCFQKAQHCHNLRCLPILFYLASLTKGAIAAKFSKTNFLTNWDGYTDRKSFTWTHKDNDQR